VTTPEAAIPFQDLVEESQRVLAAAHNKGVVVRLAGGLAIWHLCRAARTPPLSRSYADLDLAIVAGGIKPLTDLMVGLGYQPDGRFNALNGHVRLQFNDLANMRHVDVFVGITAIHDSAETIHVRDQWFGSIDAYPPAERRERAAAAAALLDYITAQCAPNTHAVIVCAEGGSGTHGGRPCQR